MIEDIPEANRWLKGSERAHDKSLKFRFPWRCDKGDIYGGAYTDGAGGYFAIQYWGNHPNGWYTNRSYQYKTADEAVRRAIGMFCWYKALEAYCKANGMTCPPLPPDSKLDTQPPQEG